MIPPSVSNAILRFFVEACMRLYAIAFFQWRHMYPEANISVQYEDQVEHFLMKNARQWILAKTLPDPKVESMVNKIESDFYKKYMFMEPSP